MGKRVSITGPTQFAPVMFGGQLSLDQAPGEEERLGRVGDR